MEVSAFYFPWWHCNIYPIHQLQYNNYNYENKDPIKIHFTGALQSHLKFVAHSGPLSKLRNFGELLTNRSTKLPL